MPGAAQAHDREIFHQAGRHARASAFEVGIAEPTRVGGMAIYLPARRTCKAGARRESFTADTALFLSASSARP